VYLSGDPLAAFRALNCHFTSNMHYRIQIIYNVMFDIPSFTSLGSCLCMYSYYIFFRILTKVFIWFIGFLAPPDPPRPSWTGPCLRGGTVCPNEFCACACSGWRSSTAPCCRWSIQFGRGEQRGGSSWTSGSQTSSRRFRR